MNTLQPTNSKNDCENFLIEQKKYITEHNILSSEDVVIDRLLSRSIEMTDAYGELHNKLLAYPGAFKSFISLVLSVAAFWSPEKISVARIHRKAIEKVNQQISLKASDLGMLLKKRSDLHNDSGYYSDTHFDVCEVIEAAAKDNHLFNSWVKEHLADLRGEFELKYWPSLSEFVNELAVDADDAQTEASDPLTAAATAAIRHSLADFIKALFAAIEENRMRNNDRFPENFNLTDKTIASFVKCSLDLNLKLDEMVCGDYVKRLRQRERDKGKLI